MRVLIDTNILISAALFPNSIPYMAYSKAVSFPNQAIVCEQNIDELKRVFFRKFPSRIESLDRFLSTALLSIDIVPVPDEENCSEELIRDFFDRPILRAAIQARADILLTGDKDFLESGIKTPIIMSPSEFINLKIFSSQP